MGVVLQVDVLINVFGKPCQTALSLLSLLRHSGQRIDRIYFMEEAATAELERKGHGALLAHLGERAVHSVPRHWLGVDPIDPERLHRDREYFLSIRYQRGWEQSDKRFVLLVHNDIEVFDDVVGRLLDEIGEYAGAGQIGQCWWCPAKSRGLCGPDRYAEFTPSYPYLMKIYSREIDPTKRRAYWQGLNEEFKARPWPLPECRLNEWCALINLETARPATMPHGTARPFGAHVDSGARIGSDNHPVILDTGVQWFRDMNHLGHRFKHVPLDSFLRHDFGNQDLFDAEKYVRNELAAKRKLAEEYPDFRFN